MHDLTEQTINSLVVYVCFCLEMSVPQNLDGTNTTPEPLFQHKDRGGDQGL